MESAEKGVEESSGREGRHVVFLINSRFPYHSGGRETWLHNVLEQLAAREYRLSVLALRPKRSSTQFFNVPSDVEIMQAGTLHEVRSLAWMLHSYGGLMSVAYYVYRMKRILSRKLDDSDGTTIICLDTVLAATAARKAKRTQPNTRLIISCRGFAARGLARRYPIVGTVFRRLECLALDAADEIWTNGADTQEHYTAMGYHPIMIGNGVDVERLSEAGHDRRSRYSGERFRILSVATLRRIKGVEALIRAASLLARLTQQDFEIVLAGKGDATRYAALAATLGIKDRVQFLGERDDVPELMAEADIVTCLSGGGGMSMAGLEAMAAGTTIVAWDSPVYRQTLTHRRTGLLVPAWDEQALAEALAEVMADYQSFRSMGRRAQQEAWNYDWSVIAERVIERLDGMA